MIEQSSKAILSILGLVVIGCLIAAGVLLSGELDGEFDSDPSAQIDQNAQEDDSMDSGDTASTGSETRAQQDNVPVAGGPSGDPQFTDDGRRLYEGEYDSYFYANRPTIANQSNCVAGNAFPTLGNQLLYPVDAEEYGDAAFLSVLGRIFSSDEAAGVHAALKAGTENMNYDWICNPDDGTALVVLSAWAVGGTEYQLAVLSENLWDEAWDWEDGESFTAGSNETVYVYSDGNLNDLEQTPVIWFEDSYLGDVNSWKIYEIDTFFGDSRPVEDCEVVAVSGQKYTACTPYN